MPTNTSSSRSRRVMAASAGLLAASLAVAGVADAGKGGNDRGGTSSTDSLAIVPVEMSGSILSHGDKITFAVSTSGHTPVVTLECFQSGVQVLVSSAGFHDAYPWSRDFRLQSMAWNEGAANCRADLQVANKRGNKWATTASVSFDVQA